ncbi:PREDICTED: alkane hydroxylase MAH1-like [Tarenaya hassleriana]|uniref:alkane hydroxylase MAH1-like n=1 Tax=Tarenaya hassleriana TaxID=28532 RepID=UPI00053C2E0F|nr:PREDICTED: alkane hydroxylase MAH1-like [Tarenaya hassleriana]
MRPSFSHMPSLMALMVNSLEISVVFFLISLLAICFFFFFINKKTHAVFPTNWPFLGMLPALLQMLHQIYDYSADLLESSNMTFLLKGPWFAGIDMLITVDPANIHHIMSSNFLNYTKGPEFNEVFEVFGEAIFNTDSDLWKDKRKSAQVMLNHHGFQRFTLSTTVNKIKKGLVPLLDHAAKLNVALDLQDVFQRFAFDTTFFLVSGFDAKSLSIEMPEVELARALDDAEEAIVYRHVKPKFLWRMQNWIGFGSEKKIRRARETFDRVCRRYISVKREEIRTGFHSEGESMDLLTSYMNLDTTKYKLLNPKEDQFLQDIILTFMVAGTNTIASALSWLFWILSKNPNAVAKIREEISTKLPSTGNLEHSFDPAELNKLVYLHGALCETLRLYPPVPFQRKSPIKPDILPSGHKVDAKLKIIFAVYALGRARAVWGDDASEFKPERWISDNGGLKHVPSFKFYSFGTGPRTCLGRDVAFVQMKLVAMELLQNYDFKVVEGHLVEPVVSMILQMKHGLKVTVTKMCLA